MNWNRADLKQKGKAAFQANYWKCVLVAFIFTIVAGSNYGSSSSSSNISEWKENFGAVQNEIASNGAIAAGLSIALSLFAGLMIFAAISAILLDVFVFNLLEVGCQRFFIENSYNPQTAPGLLGCAFKNGHYKNVAKTMFLRDLYTFLWSLLLIVPGIVKAYEYRMIPYLLAENPDLPTEEAFQLSKQMMSNQKWDAFVLDLSFIGWNILSALTIGVLGVFYVTPYRCATSAQLYLALKGNYGYWQTQNQLY